uniref:Arrestin_C domain-containing protein n=1 Tax=Syphacia muris TaxID=451379 RepID=A0A0N5A9K4_9BILA
LCLSILKPRRFQTFPFRLELDFIQNTHITSLSGAFEGKWRTSVSGQVEVRPITTVHIDFNDLLQQWRQPSGKFRAPAGHHYFDSQIVIGEECPGSFSGKNGYAEYGFVIKIRLAGRFGHTELTETRPVHVIPVVDLTPFVQHLLPVTRCKTFRKKVFCINKANANVVIRLEKAAFVQGESIAIDGEIINEHQSNVLKAGLVELIMSTRYICKKNDKTL